MQKPVAPTSADRYWLIRK